LYKIQRKINYVRFYTQDYKKKKRKKRIKADVIGNGRADGEKLGLVAQELKSWGADRGRESRERS